MRSNFPNLNQYSSTDNNYSNMNNSKKDIHTVSNKTISIIDDSIFLTSIENYNSTSNHNNFYYKERTFIGKIKSLFYCLMYIIYILGCFMCLFYIIVYYYFNS